MSFAIDIFADSLGKSQPTTDWSPGAELREVTGMHRQYVCVDDSALYNLGDSKATRGQSTNDVAFTQSYSGQAPVQRRPGQPHNPCQEASQRTHPNHINDNLKRYFAQVFIFIYFFPISLHKLFREVENLIYLIFGGRFI